MAQFKSNLCIELKGKQLFALNSQLIYNNDKYIIILHEGFISDGASIPRSLWSIYGCPFGGVYTMAAFIHDALYQSHLFSKEDADKIFFEAMLSSGVDRMLARQLYMGVNIFGKTSYNEKTDITSARELIEIKIKGYDD